MRRTNRTAVTIPEDLGGLHGLALRNGDDLVARVYFVIETSIVEMSPTSGPAGTPVTIHLKGVGWTEYDNIYVATYDNAYMGYACGFNSQGDVVINFTATGEPGQHLIDLYPGIYQGPPTEQQQLYRLPQLTYADDHPGNKIPALRFTFEVTPTHSHVKKTRTQPVVRQNQIAAPVDSVVLAKDSQRGGEGQGVRSSPSCIAGSCLGSGTLRPSGRLPTGCVG